MLVLTSVVLSGCAGEDTEGSSPHRLTTWASGTQVGQSIGILEHDVAAVDAALDGGSAAAIRTACGELQVDASSPVDQLPAPDPIVTDDLNRAYNDEMQAAQACYQGAGGGAELVSRARVEDHQGVVLLQAAADRITQITGSVLPTTTTTAPPGTSGDPFGGE